MDSYPAPYSPTGYGLHDGEAVVQTPQTVKTLQGEAVETVLELLAAMDGETPASDLVAAVPEATRDHLDLLYEHDLAYDAAAIPDGLAEAGCAGLLEPALAAIDPEHHHKVPGRLDSLSVTVFGAREPVSTALSRLQAAGVSVTEGAGEVVLLSEHLERSPSWADANEQWLAGDGTLCRARLTERGWRLGPVLTADAPACLHCLYSRVDANKAGGQLFGETVAGEPPYARAYADAVTEVLFRTLLRQVPRYLDEQYVVYDHYEQDRDRPRVFALPHCEVCNSG